MRDFIDTVLQAPFLACYDPQKSGKSGDKSLWEMKEISNH